MPTFCCPFSVAYLYCCLNNCCLLLWALYFALPFYLRCHFLLPNFPVAQFSAAHFPVAVFSLVFSVFVISDSNFASPCFPTISVFVAEFSRCPFSIFAFFPLPLFHTLILCCPVFLPSHFSLVIFPIAEFSGCPCFRCCFYLFRGNVITFNSFITPCFSKFSEIYSSTEYHSDAVCIVLTD